MSSLRISFVPSPDSRSSPSSVQDQTIQFSNQNQSKADTMNYCRLLAYGSIKLDISFKKVTMDALRKNEYYDEIMNEIENDKQRNINKKQ